MSLLAEVIASVTALSPHEAISRVEVSRAQYAALKALAQDEPTVFSDRLRAQGDRIFGVPVIVVEADLPKPVIVYADGRRDER